MSGLMDKIFSKAKQLNKHIVLPEGEEPRIIEAAKKIARLKLARLTLIGDKDKIIKKTGELDGINIINPEVSPKTNTYAEHLFQLRKSKGISMEQAQELVKDPLYFGVLMVKNGDADGMVAGAINPTGNVLRPALQIIKACSGMKTISSCFIMTLLEGSPYGEDGVMIFADCAVNIDPDAESLAEIAISSAHSARVITGIEPVVAMLSFSTKGSAKHENAEKVIKATELVKQRCPEMIVDGELQADAALNSTVAALKAPQSPVQGKANVLIFPDLQSGNIGYKLVQRLANAEAIGPICQGFAKPVNDLSRGCDVDDVVGVVAITALQSK